MKKLIITICILAVCLMGCGNKGELIADGNTTVTSDFLMMRAYYSPGGEMTQEEWESRHEIYQIFSNGDVVNKDDIKVRLNEEDYEKILDYYSAFCKGKVKQKKIDAQDYSSYGVTVYDKDKEYKFSSDGGTQSEAVEDIFGIISPYFADGKIVNTYEVTDADLSEKYFEEGKLVTMGCT